MKRVLHKRRHDGAVKVAGLVLAGGRGTRVGGRDKGLLVDRGQTRVARAGNLLAPWCDVIVVSANRNVSRYLRWADVVATDASSERLGPLAGIAAGLACVTPHILLTCPCDASRVPADVPLRLLRGLHLHGCAEVAVLRDQERLQPLLLAVRGRLRPSIEDYLDRGERSVHGWLATVNVLEIATHTVIGNRNVA